MSTTQVPERDEAVRPRHHRLRTAGWLIGGVALALALFAGGFFLADKVRAGGADPLSSAAEGITLQQLVVLSQQADNVIQQVPKSEGDPETVLNLAVRLQSLAVEMGDLAKQSTSPELKQLTDGLSEAYLKIGVGLAVNSSARVNDGIAQLKDSQIAFRDYLGVEEPAQPENKQEQDQPSQGEQGQ